MVWDRRTQEHHMNETSARDCLARQAFIWNRNQECSLLVLCFKFRQMRKEREGMLWACGPAQRELHSAFLATPASESAGSPAAAYQGRLLL